MKPKDPRREAEDKLFKRATPATRELLDKGRKLQRQKDREAYWNRIGGGK